MSAPIVPASSPQPAQATQAAGAQTHLRTVGRGGGLNLLGAAIYGMSSFVLLWVLNKQLGTRDAGVVLVGIAAFNIAAKMAELGCSTGLIRWNSRVRALDRVDLVPNIARIAVVPVLIVSVAMAAALWIGAPTVATWFGSEAEADSLASVLRAMAPFLPAASLHSVLIQGTRGFDTMVAQTLIEKVGRALALPLAVVVAHRFGASLAGVAGAWAATSAVALIASVLAYRVLYLRHRRAADGRLAAEPELTVAAEDEFAGRMAGGFWRFTALRAVGQTFEVAVNWIDTLLVGAMMSTYDAGIYASGTRYALLGLFTSDAVMQACGPKVSGLLAKKDSAGASDVVTYATGWQVMVAWPTYLMVIAFAPALLDVFGSETQLAHDALVFLSVGIMVAALAGPASSVILMAGRGSSAVINTFAAVMFNLLGNLWAIPRWGITGAGAIWAVTLIIQAWLPAIQAMRTLNIRTFGRPGWIACGVSTATFGLSAAVCRVVVGPTWLGVAVAALAGAPAYAAVVWRLRDELALDAILPGRLRKRLSGPHSDESVGTAQPNSTARDLGR